MWEKLKPFLANDAYFMAILILLIGVISFGLGRLSVTDGVAVVGSAPALQELTPSEANNSFKNNASFPVVASKSGSKYHLLDCPGALQMNPENRIEFSSAEEARAAGYAPAGNCPGI